MKKLLCLGALILFLVLASFSVYADVDVTIDETSLTGGGNPGSIWTTRDNCGDEQQDVNHYLPGEHVFINGANFDERDYDWTIKGQPGGASCDPSIVVASGTKTVNSSGAFCFDAYTVANDDCGEYKVKFENKGDNYNVIPEFGLVVGIMTVLSAVGVFFFIRRK